MSLPNGILSIEKILLECPIGTHSCHGLQSCSLFQFAVTFFGQATLINRWRITKMKKIVVALRYSPLIVTKL